MFSFISKKSLKVDKSKVLKEIEEMENSGASFIDIGAESTRPNSVRVSVQEEMDRLKDEFANGAQKKGFDKQKAIELFDLIVKFAGYGFNKSHSAAYAMITFYTSYLKTYYPVQFLASLLTSEKDNTDKVVRYIDEVKRMGYELVPPNINKSDSVFNA